MNLSDVNFGNPFVVCEEFRATDPMSSLMDQLRDPRDTAVARVDVQLPLGCPFSLFLVRGYPRVEEDEPTCQVASLVVNRKLAQALAERLDEADILEMTVTPRPVKELTEDDPDGT